MSELIEVEGPLAGLPYPRHGGRPGSQGCSGCTDCCHLSEIAVTEEEAQRLKGLDRPARNRGEPLVFLESQGRPGWLRMQGPCVFRRADMPLEQGGCSIYEDRPGSCVIFSCSLLLELRRQGDVG